MFNFLKNIFNRKNIILDVHKQIICRYYSILVPLRGTPDNTHDEKTDIKNLIWMCEEILDNGNTMPIDKVARWVGYIQGCMIMRGILTTETERNITRPLFREAYMKTGQGFQKTRQKPLLDGCGERPTSPHPLTGKVARGSPRWTRGYQPTEDNKPLTPDTGSSVKKGNRPKVKITKTRGSK